MNTRVARQRRSRPTKYLKFELPLKYLTSLASLRGPESTRSPFNSSSLLAFVALFQTGSSSFTSSSSCSSCSRKRFEEARDRVGIEPIREIERKETGNGGRRHVISRCSEASNVESNEGGSRSAVVSRETIRWLRFRHGIEDWELGYVEFRGC